MFKRRKGDFFGILMSFCVVTFCLVTFEINQLMAEQNSVINDLSDVEYLSSSSQRLTRMMLTGYEDPKVTYYIDQQTILFLSDASDQKLFVLQDPETREIADQVMENWYILLGLFQLPETEEGEEATYNIDSIVLAADNHFNSMTDLSAKINSYTGDLAERIEEKRTSSYYILGIIAYLVISNLATTSIVMAQSRELAAVTSVDVATHLYNRSKCQELLQKEESMEKERTPAFVVIDLNDLKLTNDMYGHKIGDQLIAVFATLLKESLNVHRIKPFVGRYGGDEFIIYYEDVIGEEEIEIFIKELAFRTEEENKKESNQFKISYALGYAINTLGKDGLKTPQLFVEADENMYHNKKAMKALAQASNTK
ncbi:MAG: diguanylate cyclase [Eubacteriales bacterium]